MATISSRSLPLPESGPGLTRICGAGFLLRPAVPGGAGSYLRSTGVYPLRPTDGEVEQVYRRVDVPVEDQAAGGAYVGALGQEQLGFHRSAARTRLAGREEPASKDDLAAVPPGFVAEHPGCRAESLVSDGAGQLRLRVMPATFRSSRTTVSYRLASWLVALCSASARMFATRAWMRASFPACLRLFAEPFAFRECARLARRSFLSDVRSGFWPPIVNTLPSLSAPVSKALTPRSTPMTEPDRLCRPGTARSTSQVNDTNHRCAVRVTVADRMRAVPFSSLRASFRVDSCVVIVPSLGSVTLRPPQRIVPAPNRKESRHLPRFLNRGNPSLRPARSPFLDFAKSWSARSRSRNAS